MKLGIALLVIGIVLLIGAIPYSIVSIVTGVAQLEAGTVAGGFLPWTGVIGVITGFVLTTIGSVRVFKH